MPSRRHFLAGSAAAAGLAALPQLAAAAPAAADAAPAGPPHLVVILADDLGYGDLGAYGQKLITTPRIDRIAAEGLRFTDAYSAAAVCAPSRAALLTGLHTGHAAVRANPSSGGQGSLGAGDTTFAEVLRARGYRTGLFGKWGFGPEAADQPSHPAARGFEEFYGYIDHSHAHEYYPSHLWHNDAKETVPAGTFAPDAIAERALAFIDTHATGADPFLLFLAPNLPHAPSEIPDVGAYAAQSWTQANKAHAAQISHLDAQVGAVVDRLKALGIAERTVLLIASDNGPHEEGGVNPDLFDANGPLRGYKRNLYEGGVRVPLIAWAPGRIAAGTTSARPTPSTTSCPPSPTSRAAHRHPRTSTASRRPRSSRAGRIWRRSTTTCTGTGTSRASPAAPTPRTAAARSRWPRRSARTGGRPCVSPRRGTATCRTRNGRSSSTTSRRTSPRRTTSRRRTRRWSRPSPPSCGPHGRTRTCAARGA
ncbi:sulfatase-like hydrolase/transferase [Streptomyces nojiriensis]